MVSGMGQSGDLYRKAIELVVDEQRTSTAFLQRKLGVPYNEAASLIDRMLKDGVISDIDQHGRRKVLLERQAPR